MSLFDRFFVVAGALFYIEESIRQTQTCLANPNTRIKVACLSGMIFFVVKKISFNMKKNYMSTIKNFNSN